jgi:hypothetical protein
MKKQGLLLLLVISPLLLTGCVNNPFSSYKTTSDRQIAKIYNGNLKSAMSAKETPDVLYNMEYGMLLRIGAQYDDSNIYFSRAQQSVDIWLNSWQKTANETAAMLINDSSAPYQPKGYEKTFLATYYAMNQVDLNSYDNARVEIMRMYQFEQAIKDYNQLMYNKAEIASEQRQKDKTQNYLYQEILKNYDFKDINSPRVLALKNSYQNAFGHYLAGFVFEALNEPSLARPGYVNAGQLNPTNTLIQKSINNLDRGVRPGPNMTDLLIVEEVGHAPQLQSMEAHVAIHLNLVGNNNSCVNMINVFYPQLVLDKTNASSYDYLLDTTTMSPLPMVDVDLMSARALHDDVPHIIARNVAAALRNIATAQAACATGDQQTSSWLQLGAALTGAVLDRADERTLTLLPSKININRVILAYGKHSISVTVNGQIHTQEITLTKPYQIITFRIMGDQVFFDTQHSMVTT